MRVPEKPPQLDAEARMRLLLQLKEPLLREEKTSEYLPWDKFKHRQFPPSHSPEQWWHLEKLRRRANWKVLPLLDRQGRPFVFGMTDGLLESLHKIDQQMAGNIALPEQVTNPEDRDHYVIRSLIEESLHSSQIEGAVVTRKAAKEMIRTGRKPRDKHEQMVLNNFFSMERIKELKSEPLKPGIICDLHRRITDSTLTDPEDCGKPRRAEDSVNVIDDDSGEIIHVPPDAAELPYRLKALCEFANKASPKYFIHPVIRAIILHFWLAYDHPFVDGNGRCARALFYWSMLNSGYWLMEFLSISRAVHKTRQQYYRAFLSSETDDNDLTYFLHFHVEAIARAEENLRHDLARKTLEVRELDALLRGSDHLNHRQRALLQHALRHETAVYTIKGHQNSHRVVYQTARADLLELKSKGLLISRRLGKAMQFAPVKNLGKRIQALGEHY